MCARTLSLDPSSPLGRVLMASKTEPGACAPVPLPVNSGCGCNSKALRIPRRVIHGAVRIRIGDGPDGRVFVALC